MMADYVCEHCGWIGYDPPGVDGYSRCPVCNSGEVYTISQLAECGNCGWRGNTDNLPFGDDYVACPRCDATLVEEHHDNKAQT